MSWMLTPKFQVFIARAVIAAAAVLIPWSLFLAATLPAENLSRHYRLTWVGFDLVLALLLAVTAVSIFRQSEHHDLYACASGILLFVDSWFDVTGAGNRADYLVAMLMATVISIPAGIFLILYAIHAKYPVELDVDQH